MPVGIRLAGWHQRHAGADGVQFQDGRLSSHHGGTGANAHPGHRGGARGEDPEVCAAGLLRSCTAPLRPRRANIPGAGSTRNLPGRRRTIPNSSRSGSGTRAKAEAIRDKCLGKPGVVTEESKPATPAFAVALRFDQPATGGERAVWLFGQEHAWAGASALRAAQGADLSEDRFAGVAGGLHRHGRSHAGDARRHRLTPRSPSRFSSSNGSGQTSAFSTTPKFRITSPSSPRRWRRRTSQRAGTEAL